MLGGWWTIENVTEFNSALSR